MKLAAATTIFYHGTFAIATIMSTNSISSMIASAIATERSLRGSNRHQWRKMSYYEDSDNEGCQGTYAPVLCGEEGEEFLNLCIAESVGFSSSDCHVKRRDLVIVITNTTDTTNTTNSTYPTNTTNLVDPCTREYAPVLCGGVEYGNLCSAKQAGHSEDDCEPDPLLDISFTIQIHDNLTDIDQPSLEKFDFDAPLP